MNDEGEKQFSLYNFTEELVAKELEKALKEREDVCKCLQCRNDMASYALNQLKPKYITSRKGDVFARLGEMETQMRADVLIIVEQGIQKVKDNPRHE